MNPALIPPDVHGEIMLRLAHTEREHGVRILLAVESGSRAWGFHSPNSDFDVRFIYTRQADWYLAVDLEERRDVIEYPIVDDIDLNGWDLRKALRLFWKCNPTFVEWLQSPINYIEQGCFAAQVRTLLPQLYAVDRGIHHYRNMAQTDYKNNLRESQVQLKKYLYALRAILSVQWLERYARPAPIGFNELLHLIEHKPELLADINALLARKRISPEMGIATRISSIHAFIEDELTRFKATHPQAAPAGAPLDQLNAIFHSTLAEPWPAA